MARFDVYSIPDGPGFLLDVQADLLSALNTRVVVPLLPLDLAPAPAERLNPVFDIHGHHVSMVTQFMAAMPKSELKTHVLSLERDGLTILAAIDFLHQGW
jgi:toxin CcdB